MLEATFQDCLEHHLIPMGLIGGKKTKSIDEGVWHIYIVSTMWQNVWQNTCLLMKNQQMQNYGQQLVSSSLTQTSDY